MADVGNTVGMNPKVHLHVVGEPCQLRLDGLEHPVTRRREHPDSGKRKRARASSPSQLVIEFHHAFRLPVRESLVFSIPEEEVALRAALIEEETSELVEALTTGDVFQVADALADVVYVAYGTAVHFGIDLDVAIAEVHRSNMSKLGQDGLPFLRPDGKVLKGPSYTPPDIRGALLRKASADHSFKSVRL